MLIDGTSQPGYAGTPDIQIQPAAKSSSQDGLTLAAGSDGSSITGLCISGFSSGAGISLASGHNLVQGNYLGINIDFLGTDATGTVAAGNATGVLIDAGASANTIGHGNVIGFNSSAGIDISGIGSASPTSGNLVAGNFIGTDPTGLELYGNKIGVLIDANSTGNVVGGSPAGRNIISANIGPGVDIRGSDFSGPTTGNVVSANYIGTDATGTHVVTSSSVSFTSVSDADSSDWEIRSGSW